MIAVPAFFEQNLVALTCALRASGAVAVVIERRVTLLAGHRQYGPAVEWRKTCDLLVTSGHQAFGPVLRTHAGGTDTLTFPAGVILLFADLHPAEPALQDPRTQVTKLRLDEQGHAVFTRTVLDGMLEDRASAWRQTWQVR